MTADEVRQKYLNFFKKKGHTIIPGASLLPENDPTSLFTSSGMQPLIPYLMGEKHPAGVRIADIQQSFRAGDIEEVGDNRHITCFEMLGNWSLGDYFKKEQLNWFWEFLTDELRLDPNRLYVTVFAGNKEIGVERDDTSVEIWQEIFSRQGISAEVSADSAQNGIKKGERIFFYDETKNWWSRSGPPANMPVGEIGGPDSEVFYDMGADLKRHENSPWKDKPCHVNCDCGRFIEIGNSVFIEFIKKESGFEPLKQKNVDFGGGLERITMILQGKTNIFATDLYSEVIAKISALTGGKKYSDNIKAFEIIADHLKGAVFIMGDDKGVAPANVDQGYIVRRLIRRALLFGSQLGIENENWTQEIADIIINTYKKTYAELAKNYDFIIENLQTESVKFNKTLVKGEKEFQKWANQAKKNNEQTMSGDIAFKLFATYGFPVELTAEMAANIGKKVDLEGFKTAMKKHQDLSRTAAQGKFKGGLADTGKETTALHTAAHLLLAALRQVLGDHVTQKGSNITAKRLRFDFSHPQKLTDEEKQKITALVNKAIDDDLPVSFTEMPLKEAQKKGVNGVFTSKYGEIVKVYTIGQGDKIFSQEICGGPHVKNTGELGKFKIIKEQSSSAGIRRIKAVLE